MAIKATVRETTKDAYEATDEKLGAFADKAYEEGRAYAEDTVREQRNAFKHFCLSIVGALRRGGDGLREDGYATAAGLVDDVAARAEEMTDEIDEFDLRSTRERVEDFARERPVITYGALALAGFIAANALQSASRRRQERHLAEQPVAQRKSNTRPAKPASSTKSASTTGSA